MAELENLLWTIKDLSLGSLSFRTDWNWKEGKTSYSCDVHVKGKWISVPKKIRMKQDDGFPLCQPTKQANCTQRNRLASSKEQSNLCNLISTRKLEYIFLEMISAQHMMFKMQIFFSLQALLQNFFLTMWKQLASMKKKKKSTTIVSRFVNFKLIWGLCKKFFTTFIVWQEKADTDKMSVVGISRQCAAVYYFVRERTWEVKHRLDFS